MQGHDFEIISVLASVLWGGTVAVIRYLLRQLEELTKATKETNVLNARLAELWVAEQQKRSEK